MRIWIINHYAIPPSQAGITRHYSLAQKLTKRGHEVTIIASNFNHYTRQNIITDLYKDFTEHEIDGVRFRWVKTPYYKDNSPVRFWNMLVFTGKVFGSKVLRKADKPDIIIGSSAHPFAAWAAERMADHFDVPFIMEVRDLWPQTLIDLGKMNQMHPFIKLLAWLEFYLYRKAKRIITLLPGAVNYISGLGISPEKVFWLPNGIDLDLIPAIIPPAHNSVFTIMYAGAHGLANGLDTIIDAAHIFQQQGGEETVLIKFIGNGPDKQSLIKRASRLSNIIFEDPVPKNNIYDKLIGADAFIVVLKDSSLYQWGISLNKIYDYMAMCRPIIIAVNAFNDPVKESGAGISVPPEDPMALTIAIKEIALMSKEELNKLGENGRKYVEENHDFSKLAKRLEELLLEVTSEHNVKIMC